MHLSIKFVLTGVLGEDIKGKKFESRDATEIVGRIRHINCSTPSETNLKYSRAIVQFYHSRYFISLYYGNVNDVVGINLHCMPS